jgi:CheY-like chemotaxis protein
MAGLTPRSREAVLLHSIEGFTLPEIAEVMASRDDEVADLIEIARREMMASVAGRVLIIEDDPVIGLDLEGIVLRLGHGVTGIARNRTDAVALAIKDPPDLVLADVQLADNSSGIDAVNEILAQFSDMPVIFITGYPEKLLTGVKPEPAFLIAKPFGEDQVRSAVSQAMFFASTETLHT